MGTNEIKNTIIFLQESQFETRNQQNGERFVTALIFW